MSVRTLLCLAAVGGLIVTPGCGLFSPKCDDDEDLEDGECVEEDDDDDEDEDSGTDDSGGSGGLRVVSYNISETEARLSLVVVTEGAVNEVSMQLIETGDPGFSCGPDKAVECGVWTETHDQFAERGTGRFTLDLDVVDRPGDQVNNSTTLFSNSMVPRLTVLVEARGGGSSACAVGGEQPAYFADRGCTPL